MHENSKLAEAQYFYSQMVANFNDRERFNCNLSAFLSSARSVLQYASEEAEAKAKSGGLKWLDSHMAGSPVLSFFRCKRNINIHHEPVKPAQHTNVTATETVHVSESISVTHRDASGKILYQSPPEIPKPKLRKSDTPAVITSRYVFADWAGSEDVMTLSQMYLDELQRVVKDGIHKGFLTG
jgi:hypothetical protein